VSVSPRPGRCSRYWRPMCPHRLLGSSNHAVRQKGTRRLCPAVLLLPRTEVLPPRRSRRLRLRKSGEGERAGAAAPGAEQAASRPGHDRGPPGRRAQVWRGTEWARGMPGAGLPCLGARAVALVLRDLDLVTEINARAPLVVFSLISAPDSPSRERVRQILNPARRTVRRAKALRSHGADCESRHPDRHQPDTHPTRFV